MPEGQQSGVAAIGGALCEKAVTHGNRRPIENPKHSPSTVHYILSGCLVLTQISRDYTCTLIVHLQAMDPQCNASMIEKEEQAWQHFEKLKDTLPILSPCWWKKDFKAYVDKFLGEHL